MSFLTSSHRTPVGVTILHLDGSAQREWPLRERGHGQVSSSFEADTKGTPRDVRDDRATGGADRPHARKPAVRMNPRWVHFSAREYTARQWRKAARECSASAFHSRVGVEKPKTMLVTKRVLWFHGGSFCVCRFQNKGANQSNRR